MPNTVTKYNKSKDYQKLLSLISDGETEIIGWVFVNNKPRICTINKHLGRFRIGAIGWCVCDFPESDIDEFLDSCSCFLLEWVLPQIGEEEELSEKGLLCPDCDGVEIENGLNYCYSCGVQFEN